MMRCRWKPYAGQRLQRSWCLPWSGTGKTTTTQGIIAAYRTFGLNILLAAPTGRAAKRITEAQGLEAKTIHRLLEFKPPEGYQKNEETRLRGMC